MKYNSPEEAIAACNAECENAWKMFTKVNKIDESVAPDAVAVAKRVFQQGYMAGARFVSGVIVEKMIEQ